MRDRETRASSESAHLMRRVNELETDRTRMAAILSGMVEGVLVVDGDGRLRLANDAARRMLNLESDLLGRHYVEAVRQPGVVGQLDAALKGEQPASDRSAARRGESPPAARGFFARRPLPRPPTAEAPCSSCTTSAICAGPIACGAISWRTSRTSCARR